MVNMRLTMAKIVALGLGAILALGVTLLALLYTGLKSVEAPLDNLTRLSKSNTAITPQPMKDVDSRQAEANRVARDLNAQVVALHEANRREMKRVLWQIALFIVAASGITVFVIGVVTRPVRMLKDAAEAIRRGEFGHRIEPHGQGELRYLAEDINRIVSQLETASATRGDLQRMTARLRQESAERRRAEEGHRKLQAEARKSAGDWLHTFDALQFPIFILDLGGTAFQANRAASELSGLALEEMYRRPIASLGSGGLWSKAGQLAATIRDTRKPISVEAQDAVSGRTWEVTANMFTEPGIDEPRILIVIREITQMMKLQESLRRTATMSAMGSLVAGVAHEVRNPIFGISSTLDAMEARLGTRQEYENYVRILRGELDRISQLMRDLLEYGKPFEFRLSPHPIAKVIEQAVDACSPQAKAAGVEIRVDIRNGSPQVRMDPDRLRIVFRNLLENAVQHSPSGGNVSVEVRQNHDSDRTWVACVVRDSGTGFPAEALGRAFEPFFTLRKGGTGLGLAIAQRTVEEHGGEISADNRSKGGAVVRVRLPIVSDSPGTGERADGLQNLGSR